ncbi:sulfate reduction electron transfer complex DsrMKJOP subunit DsrK [Magnetospirillum fulvum]|uniref:Fe-S oxidoreductase n=1 Tax=Magnetospirillum fulvum TaxID=1082 RepID=A0A1H6HWT1_MAGFU|nr:(Fe-S)-binding protein [Magnetospirillum fulvum]SEH40530.1 Fe-S oxidoreductase [Magnetospirillum fulvum]
MADFVPPPLWPEIGLEPVPSPEDGLMAACRPFVAAPAHNQALGFPGELVEDWETRAVARLGELLAGNRALRVYLDACVGCGACADKCHFFLGTGDANNMPVARQNLLRAVYCRHFTPAGRLLGPLAGAGRLDRARLDSWYGYFHQCSQCRRCSVFCPMGIDTAELSMAAREIMNSIGLGQKYCNEIIGKVYAIGNNLGLPPPALADTLEGLEEDVRDESGHDVRFPLDVRGAEVLLVTPSADFFAEPHVDGLIGYAKVFHQAGLSWTLSSYASEAANFGLFIGSVEQMRKIALRIRAAALDLGVKRIVFGECGHAWRVAHAFLEELAGPFDFLDPRYPRPQHIAEITADLIRTGGIRLDPDANAGMVVTLHDSCNVARASRMGDEPGGQFTLPREIVRAAVPRFVEMHPDTTHDRTFCCGGGGGLLTDDLIELRIKGARPRMQALKQVVEQDGVTHLCALCAICKSQFTKVLPAYGFDREMMVSLHQLVGQAIRLGTSSL